MVAQAVGGLLVGASVVVPRVRRLRAFDRRLRATPRGWRRAQMRQQWHADEAVRRATSFSPLAGGGVLLWSDVPTPR